MNHRDHVDLLRAGAPGPGGVWADFGSGDGAFTLALRELVGADADITSIDRDRGRLERQRAAFAAQFPATRLHLVAADLTQPLDLPPLDGAVMANVLHFFRDKAAVLRTVRGYLKPGGRLLLVEYNVDQGNLWVPHPLSFATFQRLAPQAGLAVPRLLGARPSRFLKEIYAALALRDDSFV